MLRNKYEGITNLSTRLKREVTSNSWPFYPYNPLDKEDEWAQKPV
jgi:hypothetical protein